MVHEWEAGAGRRHPTAGPSPARRRRPRSAASYGGDVHEARSAGRATWLPVPGRFARGAVADGMCLRCHGPRESLDRGLLRALHDAYPEDRATGYALGDLRGVLRVTVPRGSAAVR